MDLDDVGGLRKELAGEGENPISPSYAALIESLAGIDLGELLGEDKPDEADEAPRTQRIMIVRQANDLYLSIGVNRGPEEDQLPDGYVPDEWWGDWEMLEGWPSLVGKIATVLFGPDFDE
jgi:hypothetical protein